MLTPEQLKRARLMRSQGWNMGTLSRMFGLTNKELKKELTR